MHETLRRAVAAVIVLSALAACAQPTAQADASWAAEFDFTPSQLSTTGRNDYFVLEPGHYFVLRDADGNQVTVTVLDQTKKVAGVKTRVIEERELKKGKLAEVSKNYFAIHKVTRDALYFGEDVTMYEDGKAVSHDGSWLAGVNGAKPGLIMPGQARVGYRYYQELASGIAMDRAEILSTGETVETPAGKLENCLKVEETNALKSTDLEHKYFAPGIGLVKEETLLLVEHGNRKRSK